MYACVRMYAVVCECVRVSTNLCHTRASVCSIPARKSTYASRGASPVNAHVYMYLLACECVCVCVSVYVSHTRIFVQHTPLKAYTHI